MKSITGLAGWQRIITGIGAGILGALAQAPYYVLPLLPLSFAVLLWLFDGAAHQKHPRRAAFATGFWVAFGYLYLSLYWMAFSFLHFATSPAHLVRLGIAGFIGVGGLAAFIALFYGTATLVAARLNIVGWPRALALAVAWSVAEYARGHLFTGLPWNMTGQTLAGFAPLAQLAAWTGPYGLSFVVILLALLPAAAWPTAPGSQWQRPPLFLAAGLVVLLAIPAVVRPRPVDVVDNIRLQIVQPNISQADKINSALFGQNFLTALDLSGGAVFENLAPDEQVYVIWPENAAYNYFQDYYENGSGALDMIARSFPTNAVLLTGAIRIEAQTDGIGENYYNSFHVIADITGIGPTPKPKPTRAIITSYDKHHLAPFGEFVPLGDLWRAIGLDKLLPINDAFSRGEGPATLPLGGTQVAPIICYETIFPGRMYPASARPDWILVITNDAWFGDSNGPKQHLDQAKMRAIETGLPVIRAANSGISAVIDPYGRVQQHMPLLTRGTIESGLPRAIGPTLYSRTGDLLYWLSLIVVGSGLFWHQRQSKRAS